MMMTAPAGDYLTAAPQGVHCASTAAVLNGSCLGRLEIYIENTGGKYFNPGNIPPPSP